ncbi:MAG: electron transfer flavoprotein subunit beta/FixA family protein, partial [Chloroflexi bacterium]|nr:electron transfer flavoprotein subunit beta/FixA family protein [Chloroflexota bacterium]
DRNAIEEALKIREQLSGKVTVLTMGPPQADKALEEALAMGADEAIHLCDLAFAGADSLSTAQTLAYAIRKLEHFDLVLCGNATIDSGTGQVAMQLAEFLDLPCITDAEELTFESEKSILVRRVWERGHIKVRVKLPAVIAVTDRINQPRLATVFGIMAAAQKELKQWHIADIGADVSRVGLAGSPTQFLEISEFHARRQGEVLRGPAEEVVNLAVDKLVKRELI